jgi:hypothetical protein
MNQCALVSLEYTLFEPRPRQSTSVTTQPTGSLSAAQIEPSPRDN